MSQHTLKTKDSDVETDYCSRYNVVIIEDNHHDIEDADYVLIMTGNSKRNEIKDVRSSERPSTKLISSSKTSSTLSNYPKTKKCIDKGVTLYVVVVSIFIIISTCRWLVSPTSDDVKVFPSVVDEDLIKTPMYDVLPVYNTIQMKESDEQNHVLSQNVDKRNTMLRENPLRSDYKALINDNHLPSFLVDIQTNSKMEKPIMIQQKNTIRSDYRALINDNILAPVVTTSKVRRATTTTSERNIVEDNVNFMTTLTFENFGDFFQGQTIEPNSRILMIYYQPSNEFDMNIAPVLNEMASIIATSSQDTSSQHIGTVDCVQYKQICDDHHIHEYPTFRWYQREINEVPVKYHYDVISDVDKLFASLSFDDNIARDRNYPRLDANDSIANERELGNN